MNIGTLAAIALLMADTKPYSAPRLDFEPVVPKLPKPMIEPGTQSNRERERRLKQLRRQK